MAVENTDQKLEVVEVTVDLSGVVCPDCKGTRKVRNVDGKAAPAPAGAKVTAYYGCAGIRGMFSHAKPRPHWTVRLGQVAPCQTCKVVKP